MNKYRVITHTRTRTLAIIVAVVFCVLLCCVFCACNTDFLNDNSFKNDKDYIEVESLRISNADIRLSPTGDTSTYKLNVEVLPANATNRKLTYYIPSEYHEFVHVSNDGVITAIKESDGKTIPLTVTSTTNKEATLLLSVTVERVSVERMTFKTEVINLLYNGEEGLVELDFYPAHAIDGRTVTFTSLNEDVARVNARGEVSPVGVGNATIKATSTTMTGKVLNAFTSVVVSYAKGQYQLDVSGIAQYNQVIGDFSAINFTLLILGENVDPNPEIEWYVDTERVLGISDSTQYTHIPNATTQITYHVYAYVTAYGHSTVKLSSNPITIFKPFYGIDLNYANLSDLYTSYAYGDEVTFELSTGDSSSTVVKYDWYLSRTNGSSKSIYVGSTLPSNRNFTCRINVAGDYIMSARGVDLNGNMVNQVQFEFSSEKFVEGDVLVAEPIVINDGLPPDSYHWYIVECQENGDYNDSDKVLYRDTGAQEQFTFPLEKGFYRIIVTASIQGKEATTKVNGEDKIYSYVSSPIRVYGATEKDTAVSNDLINIEDKVNQDFIYRSVSEITDVNIEGMVFDGEEVVYVEWNNVPHSAFFTVEITFTDGEIIILDSAHPVEGVTFGSNYCYIYSPIATLNDAFSLRIKQKGSLFSRTYNYGIENSHGVGDETHVLTFDEEVYQYFKPIEYQGDESKLSPAINTYLSSIQQLEELYAYIALYAPSRSEVITKSSEIINSKVYETYVTDVYLAFDLDTLPAIYTNSANTEEYVAIYGEDLAKVLVVLENVADNLSYNVKSMAKAERKGDGYTLKIYLPSDRTFDTVVLKPEGEVAITDSLNYSSSPWTDVARTFYVDNREEVFVYNSEELVFVLENGYKPIPTGSDDLSALYVKIKRALVSIIGDEMTDYEKVLAIYDYLGNNVRYNYAVIEAEVEQNYDSSYLEGVFNTKSATCLGYAKAFSAMCNVLGVKVITVVGDVGEESVGHAWNKVYLDGKWYNVDVTTGSKEFNGYNGVTHSTFMLSDTAYADFMGGVTLRGNYPPALFDYDYYLNTSYNGTTLIVDELSDIKAILSSATVTGNYAIELVFSESVFADGDAVEEFLTSADFGESDYITSLPVSESGRTRIVIFDITVM